MSRQTDTFRAELLDVFGRARHPLSASEAARLAGGDPISGAASVYALWETGALVRVGERKTYRYELAIRVEQRTVLLPLFDQPATGTHSPFGLVCGRQPMQGSA
jgi:hypothetical protein